MDQLSLSFHNCPIQLSHGLGAFKLEMTRSHYVTHSLTDRRTQPFIVKDDKQIFVATFLPKSRIDKKDLFKIT